MMGSVRAEILRIAKWPVTWIVTGLWLILNLMFGYVFNYITYRSELDSGNTRVAESLLSDLSLTNVPAVMSQGLPMFGGALVMIMAALAAGSGYGWNTWKTVFTQGPSRLAAVSGMMVTLALWLIFTVTLTLLADLAASSAIMTLESATISWPGVGALAEGFGGSLLIVAMWAAGGVLLGILVRSPALSVGLGLVWALVVENLLRGVGGLLGPVEAVTNVFPGTAAGSLAGALGGTPETASASGPSETAEGVPGVLTVLSGAESAGLLALYVVVFAALAVVLVVRRDA